MLPYKEKLHIDTINNTMSLRLPQYRSLEILDRIMRSVDLSDDLGNIQSQIHDIYPIFKDFERSFPSITFALATGVGKTILMGAFIAYLYNNFNIKNYFIVAPNLTVYNKLIKDFGLPTFQKYVFKRINSFTQKPPIVITGDTYGQHVAGQTNLWDSITINIFNIGKINAEVRGNSVPQVKRLSEYIGDSYFNYLAKLPDLTVLMDESHHYRADRGMAVINELSPLLGLELTATPQVESSKGAVKFKNVVYEYSLAKAISDGFVKEPAAATRRVFDPKKYTPDEIDRIKLTDGIRIHRNTKTELEMYAENERVRTIKPFVLVVCKDTAHASEIKEYISSSDFYDGYYADKVIELHSNQKGSEKDDNIQQLLSLEDENNKIEIVIHVNMLKEGWDVTNLYTIIPLRTATSLTLREQTIGRGLRLPYGKKTGNAVVDRLTIVAHDKFEEIINAANDENSIIRKENVIVIEDNEDMGKEKEVVRPKTVFDDFIEQKEKNLKYARSEEKKKALIEDIETAKAVGLAIDEILTKPVNIAIPLTTKIEVESTPTTSQKDLTAPIPAPSLQAEIVRKVITTRDLDKPEVIELIKEKAKQHLEKDGQIMLDLGDSIEKRIETAIAPMIQQKIQYTIDIPDIVVISSGTQRTLYRDFDLSTDYWFDFDVPSDEIIIEGLHNNTVTTLKSESFMTLPDKIENIIMSEILNLETLIEYEDAADLLYKLVGQAINYIGKKKDESTLNRTVLHHKRDIAKRIVDQVISHSELADPEYEVKLIKAVTPILQQDYTKFKEDDILKYTANIPAYEIKKKVVGHFTKACHTAYKFDSVPEHIFSIILERSDSVEKWLRPATGQFKIHWDSSHLYEPDFVVETKDNIFIVEIKASKHSSDDEVKLKAKAARAYCDNVNKLFAGTGKKEWEYMLLLDAEMVRTNSFEHLKAEVEWWSLA